MLLERTDSMVELDQFKYTLSTYETPLKEVRDSLNLEAKIRRIDELDKTMEEPSFWEDAEKSTRLVKEAKNLKDTVAEYNKLQNQYEEIGLMIEMGYEENDPEIVPEIQEMLDEFTSELDALRLRTLLTGEYDNNNAILRLNAGAGGTESCDWCSMLYRMYCRWAERKGYQVEVLDFLDGEEAGIKSVTIQINGENAFGYLKSERGVHRLVRISPFNANGKRQTSFVSCDVMPDIEEDLDIEINPDDLRIDTYRSSGAGGQHINKTSSAVRITLCALPPEIPGTIPLYANIPAPSSLSLIHIQQRDHDPVRPDLRLPLHDILDLRPLLIRERCRVHHDVHLPVRDADHRVHKAFCL